MSSSRYRSGIVQTRRWHSFDDASGLEQTVVARILQAARKAIEERGVFLIVLAGGSTPRRVYEALGKTKAEWGGWHIYFGDERCLPRDHAERNSRMAALAWLDRVPIPATQIHAIPAEHGAAVAAAEYAQIVDKIGAFDLVLLGLGEDGHTASLFPGHPLGDTADAPSTLAVLDAPKPPRQRVSLSARRLSFTRQLMFLVAGGGKAQAMSNWRSGSAIPAAAITPANGVDIFSDIHFAGEL